MTYGFSVAREPDMYRVYATTHMQRLRWHATQQNRLQDYFYHQSLQCYYTNDPQFWNERCIDSIGHYWKNISSGGSNKWNAAPGTDNISTVPDRALWPVLGSTGNWGVSGFDPVINKDDINAAIPNPWPAPNHATCHPHNPSAHATAAANPKVVQVSGNRWFMAFNSQIHSEKDPGNGDPNWAHHSSDKWRVSWAYSYDGRQWTVLKELFRLSSESSGSGSNCARGALLHSMMVDGNYFYMVFGEVLGPRLYLARSDVKLGTTAGHGDWYIANGVDSAGNWKWTKVESTGVVDVAWGTSPSFGSDFAINPATLKRGTAMTRVFTSATPYSLSGYIALVSAADASGTKLYLLSSDSLAKPFKYESEVVGYSAIAHGIWGMEFVFPNWLDNVPATPRVIGPQFDLWFTEFVSNGSNPASTTTASRRTAQLSGGIFSQ